MPWPELLAGLRDELRLALPDFQVDVGTWASPPRVDAVLIAWKAERFSTLDRKLELYADVFVRMEAEDPHLSGYQRLAEIQQTVAETVCAHLRAQPGVVTATLAQWEADMGAFVPSFAARLDFSITSTRLCPELL